MCITYRDGFTWVKSIRVVPSFTDLNPPDLHYELSGVINFCTDLLQNVYSKKKNIFIRMISVSAAFYRPLPVLIMIDNSFVWNDVMQGSILFPVNVYGRLLLCLVVYCVSEAVVALFQDCLLVVF